MRTVLALLDALKGVIGLLVLAAGLLVAVGCAWMLVVIGAVLVASAAVDRPDRPVQ